MVDTNNSSGGFVHFLGLYHHANTRWFLGSQVSTQQTLRDGHWHLGLAPLLRAQRLGAQLSLRCHHHQGHSRISRSKLQKIGFTAVPPCRVFISLSAYFPSFWLRLLWVSVELVNTANRCIYSQKKLGLKAWMILLLHSRQDNILFSFRHLFRWYE